MWFLHMIKCQFYPWKNVSFTHEKMLILPMKECKFNTCRHANSTHEGMRKSPSAHVGITFQTVYFDAFFHYKFTKSSNVILTMFKLWCIHYPWSNVKITSICIILTFLFSVCIISIYTFKNHCRQGVWFFSSLQAFEL